MMVIFDNFLFVKYKADESQSASNIVEFEFQTNEAFQVVEAEQILLSPTEFGAKFRLSIDVTAYTI